MSIVLAFTPAGRITAIESTGVQGKSLDADADADADAKRMASVAKAFAASQAEGLFVLATETFDAALPPSMVYLRSFSGRYLTQLCHAPPTELATIPVPEAAELDALVLSAPPMQGAEYLNRDALADVWSDLDAWVRAQAENCEGGLSVFLKRRAPLWHQVGRVCFHLAENRRDPEYPFAFLATYAPTVTSGSRVQYQPLSHAIRQSSGQRDKKALINLLSPVHVASQRSEFARELIDSGDIYQPLAWTPPQAYRFLQEVPLLEDCGVLVRLPDWWKKRPRPRVRVTVGNDHKSQFNAQEMLDFRADVALGDEKLTAAELHELMRSDDGLMLLRGQWVEVDHGRLQEALEHWKQVEASAAKGVSFVEGMRLLAGAPQDFADDDTEDHRNWSFVQAGDGLGQLLAELRDPKQLTAVRPGTALKTTLREYQQIGVSWLSLLTGLGLGACLADDMGLGKTIQVLALLLVEKHRQPKAKPSLLVLPASLLANWKSEIERFAPSLSTVFVHPSELSAERLPRMAKQADRELQDVDVVLTTYGMLLRHTWLLEIEWRLAVLDEAQAIKNPAARQTKAVKRLKASAHCLDRNADRKPPVGPVVNLRFSLSRPVGVMAEIQAVRQAIERPRPRQSVRAASPSRAALHPAPNEDGQADHC